jgi:carbonic anhydrase/acetyltransferase-like protein (isoleucine patch superfamily)
MTAGTIRQSEYRQWHRYLNRLLKNPSQIWPIINARIQLANHARVPISVRLDGRAWIGGGGTICFGERVHIIGTTVRVEFVAMQGATIDVGEGTFINYGVSISSHEQVRIGRECQIGQYAIINDNDYHSVEDKRVLPESQPVTLEDRVWIGARAIVLKGVKIGQDSVIGAGSVVTRDVPPRCVAVGVPARVVKTF